MDQGTVEFTFKEFEYGTESSESVIKRLLFVAGIGGRQSFKLTTGRIIYVYFVLQVT